ncbi:MAG: protoporphyrinogen oxidase HemJ [Hyphomicrobiaceae bacterium]|nr:protoporphyrinogen oxidase HemJ [Hyphomicrobiaceae bacterium]
MLWLKALHVMAVIAWMAGMFYLPRLFVYHVDAKPGSEMSETFKVMEGRLYRIIMTPAIGVVWVTGLTLAYLGSYWLDGWFLAKLAMVVGMTGLHEFLGGCVKRFAADRNTRDGRFYRIVNEAPTLLMAAIVLLVIVKPF